MAETQETITEIIAEMHDLADTSSDGIIAISGKVIADRLEAAHKRERETADAKVADLQSRVKLLTDRYAELVKKCDEYYASAPARELSKICPKTGGDFGQLGNAAKLREALEHAKVAILAAEEKMGVENPIILEIIDAALASPPRNCDVGTAEEQAQRMANFCKRHYKKAVPGRHICSACKFYNKDVEWECYFAWAQMPYEEGGAK